jgi:DNA-binding MarR family transcriptional regulator
MDVATSAERRGQEVLVLLGRFGQSISAALAQQLGALDLTGNAPVLVVCELALRGPLRPTQLQEVAGLTSGGMTKQLDRLEELGLIERSYGKLKGDRRACTVTLTPRGRRAAATMSEAIRGETESIRALLAELTRLLG